MLDGHHGRTTVPPAPVRPPGGTVRAAGRPAAVGDRPGQPGRRRTERAPRRPLADPATAGGDGRLRTAAAVRAPHRAARRHGRAGRRHPDPGEPGDRPHVHGRDVRGRPVRPGRLRTPHPVDHRTGHRGRDPGAARRLANAGGGADRCAHRHRDLRARLHRLDRPQPPRRRRGRPAARRADGAAGRDGPGPGRHRRARADGTGAARPGRGPICPPSPSTPPPPCPSTTRRPPGRRWPSSGRTASTGWPRCGG